MNPEIIVTPNNTYATAVTQSDTPMASIIDSTTSAGFIYICEAAPGSATSSASWRVSRFNQATGQTQWAGVSAGSVNFDQIADNRAALSYT